MKCKQCGHRTNTINAMREHYLKKHPSIMKRRTRKARLSDKKLSGKYCPTCGKKL